jgi:hypothetical protein
MLKHTATIALALAVSVTAHAGKPDATSKRSWSRR